MNIDAIDNITANGTYYIWVKDSGGNISNQSVVVNDVDTKTITSTMFTQTGTTGQYEFIIYVPTGKTVDNIQFTNYNYMIVFNTISNLNLTGGKYYKIIQPMEVI